MYTLSQSLVLGLFCLLSLACTCHGDISNQNESYVLTPQLGTDGLEIGQVNASIAIATTILHPGPTLPAWLDYHLRRVQHVLIYMDDPNERPSFEHLCADRPVTLLDGSQAEPEMTPESRIMSRQTANTKHAIAYLMKLGYTWLIHIDADELLYGPLIDSRPWAQDSEIGRVIFTNHEALPVDFETSDPFRDCQYFWVNGIDHNVNFLAYGNGKSAVRLSSGIEPAGPHSFTGQTGRSLRPSAEEAMVLHYPYPSYDSWVRKFNRYGSFSDHWFGDRRGPKILDFMRQSRDVVQKAHKTGDWAVARAFFSSRILDDEATKEAISQGKIRHYKPFAGMEANDEAS